MDIEILNVDRVAEELRWLVGNLADAIGPALRAEAEIEMTEAKRRTPVDTGTLRASGHVAGPKHSGRDTEVMLAFGGPAAPYALFVHENLDAHHPVGQAKFLEGTLHESAPYLAQRIARRIAASIRRRS